MAISYNPSTITQGLVFSIDAANQKSISPLGCTGFNNAPQLLRNLVSRSDVINSYNGVKLGNLSYYTAFAIDYPEGSYGGDAASRQGITPGYNVRSGGKTYDASRALHLWVWNNDTSSWISDSYFNGVRLSGHCYDNWSGAGVTATELGSFASDYNTIKSAFSNCTYIVMGSHKADTYNATVRNILTDLGKPNGYIDSDYIAAPEWILVGKPGLGAGNAYGWAYQNYSTNPDQVAHLNFGLPIYGNVGNYLEFDGADDYISVSNNNLLSFGTNSFTINLWIKRTATNSLNPIITTYNSYNSGFGTYFYAGIYNASNAYENGFTILTSGGGHITTLSAVPMANNEWINISVTRNGDNITLYRNGSFYSTASSQGNDWSGTGRPTLIGGGVTGTTPLNGNIAITQIYSRALSAEEVSRNFNALRGRFGI
jgi:hypothetical protein